MTAAIITIEHGVKMVSGFMPSGKYPWARMNVGDSIRFGDGPKAIAKARANARNASERHEGKQFEAGLDESNTAYVWRTQ